MLLIEEQLKNSCEELKRLLSKAFSPFNNPKTPMIIKVTYAIIFFILTPALLLFGCGLILSFGLLLIAVPFLMISIALILFILAIHKNCLSKN